MSDYEPKPGLRLWLFRQLDRAGWQGEGMSPLNAALAGVVAVSALTASLITEPTLAEWNSLLHAILTACAVVFTVELPARLWVKWESPRWRAHPWGPWGWLLRWHSVLDMLALAAVWAEVLLGAGLGFAVMLRLLRLMELFVTSGNGAAARAAREIARAVRERRLELMISGGVAGLVLTLASVAMYLAERHVQPEVFGSIPRAMWWSVVTLTTVGYGDAVPQTAAGRVIAAITALGSVALVALPAGIMAAAFSEALQRTRRRDRD